MTRLPNSRRSEVVVQELASEILIYDLKINKAFALNETAATVYRACDGKTTFTELKLKTRFTDEIIFLSLDELQKDNLLEDDSYSSPFAGMTRREVIRQVGLASMIALPVISTIIAPSAAMAASGGTGMILDACTTTGQCSPGLTCALCAGGSCGPSLNSRCCARVNGGSGTGGNIGCAANASACAAAAASNCCSNQTVFVQTNCLNPGSGSCTCA